MTVDSGKVTRLWINAARVRGSLPEELGNLSNLEEFIIMGAQRLVGEIPESIGNLKNLRVFKVAYGEALTGNIPESIGEMTNLEVFRVQYNKLTGSIPESIGDLENLRDFNVGHNQLTGSLPSSITDLPIKKFVVQNNDLSGPIPNNIGDWGDIFWLHLENNRFTGAVPESIRDLNGKIYLYNNRFTGDITVAHLAQGHFALRAERNCLNPLSQSTLYYISKFLINHVHDPQNTCNNQTTGLGSVGGGTKYPDIIVMAMMPKDQIKNIAQFCKLMKSKKFKNAKRKYLRGKYFKTLKGLKDRKQVFNDIVKALKLPGEAYCKDEIREEVTENEVSEGGEGGGDRNSGEESSGGEGSALIKR